MISLSYCPTQQGDCSHCHMKIGHPISYWLCTVNSVKPWGNGFACAFLFIVTGCLHLLSTEHLHEEWIFIINIFMFDKITNKESTNKHSILF